MAVIYRPNDAAAPSAFLIGMRPSLLLDARLVTLSNRVDAPDLFVFARYVLADSNGDGLLTAKDRQTYGLADADGGGLTPIDVDGAFLALTPITASEAVLFVQRDDAPVAVHLDVVTKSVIREAALPARP